MQDGFVTVDGWQIDFASLVINLEDVRATQADGQFDLKSGEIPDGVRVELEGVHSVELLSSSEPVLFGSVAADVGHYNAISWEMVNAGEGTLVMRGSAEKQDRLIDFTITIEDTYQYVCGEYVGDERKGFVEKDAPGDVELTFHFDHLFGDAGIDPDDALNLSAVGFDPFAAMALNNVVDTTQSDIAAAFSDGDYKKLMETMATIGHVGEGHCYEKEGGYTGEK